MYLFLSAYWKIVCIFVVLMSDNKKEAFAHAVTEPNNCSF